MTLGKVWSSAVEELYGSGKKCGQLQLRSCKGLEKVWSSAVDGLCGSGKVLLSAIEKLY